MPTVSDTLVGMMQNHLKLWWMRRRLRTGTKAHEKYINATPAGEEREFRVHEAMEQRREHRDRILNLSSMLLSDKAESLGLPVPPLADKESWEEGYWPDTIRLNVTAQAQLRKAIREEKREKWSFVAFLLTNIATPIIGLIGVVMGLLSLLHSFKTR